MLRYVKRSFNWVKTTWTGLFPVTSSLCGRKPDGYAKFMTDKGNIALKSKWVSAVERETANKRKLLQLTNLN
jgi:hypothetical protein